MKIQAHMHIKRCMNRFALIHQDQVSLFLSVYFSNHEVATFSLAKLTTE